MSDNTDMIYKVQTSHLAKWNLAYIKYSALVVGGVCANLDSFFHGESFTWQDWAVIFFKCFSTWSAVTLAFVDNTYANIKNGSMPKDPSQQQTQPYKVS